MHFHRQELCKTNFRNGWNQIGSVQSKIDTSELCEASVEAISKGEDKFILKPENQNYNFIGNYLCVKMEYQKSI